MGFLCVLDTTGCEGRPPLSGHLLHVSGRLTSVLSVSQTVRCCWDVLRGCVPLGRRSRTCRQARLGVLGGRPMRRTGAPWRLLKFACTRAGRVAWVSASVRTVGCRQLPGASARIRWRALFDNTPVVIGSAAGSACLAGPFARPLATRYVGEEGQLGWRPRVWRCPLSLSGRWGPASAAPVWGMWEEVAGVEFASDTLGC